MGWLRRYPEVRKIRIGFAEVYCEIIMPGARREMLTRGTEEKMYGVRAMMTDDGTWHYRCKVLVYRREGIVHVKIDLNTGDTPPSLRLQY